MFGEVVKTHLLPVSFKKEKKEPPSPIVLPVLPLNAPGGSVSTVGSCFVLFCSAFFFTAKLRVTHHTVGWNWLQQHNLFRSDLTWNKTCQSHYVTNLLYLSFQYIYIYMTLIIFADLALVFARPSISCIVLLVFLCYQCFVKGSVSDLNTTNTIEYGKKPPVSHYQITVNKELISSALVSQ